MQKYEDYTKEQISSATLFLEQYVKFEKHEELKIILHTMRSINAICHQLRINTKWLSELSKTSSQTYGG